MNGNLFPVYLDKGSKGPAVAILQLLLKAGGWAGEDLLIDGDYGECSARSVRYLQEGLGVPIDGNFGPLTRDAFERRTGINVNGLPTSLFQGETEPVSELVSEPVPTGILEEKGKVITIIEPSGPRKCRISKDTTIRDLISSDYYESKFNFFIDGKWATLDSVVTMSNSSIAIEYRQGVRHGN